MFKRYFSNFWKLNKEKFYRIGKALVIVAIALFILINFLDMFNDASYTLPDTSSTYAPTYTITTGNKIAQKKYEKDSSVVENFIEFCNNGNVENAYNLLSEECKDEVYPRIEDFEEKYLLKYFKNKKQYNLQSWALVDDYNIYKIRILDDLLTTGDYSESKKYEDYITVYNDKINLNGYVKEKTIGKQVEYNDIIIFVEKVNIYVDYEIYTIEVTNNTENDIILDSLNTEGKSLSIVSENNYQYPVVYTKYIDFIVGSNSKKIIMLKFEKKYTSTEVSKYIYFSQLVMNYSDFTKNKKEYSDILELKVDVRN